MPNVGGLGIVVGDANSVLKSRDDDIGQFIGCMRIDSQALKVDNKLQTKADVIIDSSPWLQFKKIVSRSEIELVDHEQNIPVHTGEV